MENNTSLKNVHAHKKLVAFLSNKDIFGMHTTRQIKYAF